MILDIMKKTWKILSTFSILGDYITIIMAKSSPGINISQKPLRLNSILLILTVLGKED
jgi:hypothetical protein